MVGSEPDDFQLLIPREATEFTTEGRIEARPTGPTGRQITDRSVEADRPAPLTCVYQHT